VEADISEEHISSIFKDKEQTENSSDCRMIHAAFLLGLFFDPDDRGDMFLRKVFDFHRTTLCYNAKRYSPS
jgi:hypothetical protein